jgi:hypothetical protein
MSFRTRGSHLWTWSQVRERTLAIYEAEHEGRQRMAVLVWQADDPQVPIGDTMPPLLAFTTDVEPEPGAENRVALAGFDSLEAARALCVAWTGGSREVSWEALGETAQIGIYASIREPGFAERAD